MCTKITECIISSNEFAHHILTNNYILVTGWWLNMSKILFSQKEVPKW